MLNAAAENMTCIPREGIYLLSGEKLNYTEAQKKCAEYGGKLMNILTEEATVRAANVIAKSGIGRNKAMQAYVGLSDVKQEGKYLTVDGKLRIKFTRNSAFIENTIRCVNLPRALLSRSEYFIYQTI